MPPQQLDGECYDDNDVLYAARRLRVPSLSEELTGRVSCDTKLDYRQPITSISKQHTPATALESILRHPVNRPAVDTTPTSEVTGLRSFCRKLLLPSPSSTKVHFPPDTHLITSVHARLATPRSDVSKLYYSAIDIRKFKREYRQVLEQRKKVRGNNCFGGKHDNTFWRSKVSRTRFSSGTSSQSCAAGRSATGSSQLDQQIASGSLYEDDYSSSSSGSSCQQQQQLLSWLDDDSVERRKRDLAKSSFSDDNDDDSTICPDSSSSEESTPSIFSSIFSFGSSSTSSDSVRDAVVSPSIEIKGKSDGANNNGVTDSELEESMSDDNEDGPLRVDNATPLSSSCATSSHQGLFSSVFDSAREAVAILNGNCYLSNLEHNAGSLPSSSSTTDDNCDSHKTSTDTSMHLVDTLYLF